MMSADLIVSTRRRSHGLTIALVRPQYIAIATVVLSKIGRISFGVMLETFERPPVDLNPMSESCWMNASTSICLSCMPLMTRNSGSNHISSVGSMPSSMPRSNISWQYIIRSSLSDGTPALEQSAMTMASLAAARSMFSIRSPASAELTIGLPFARL